MDWTNIRHFTREEFACKGVGCCDGKELMDQDFVDKLDDLREQLGHPLAISSGYRCPDHNDKVSSTGRNGPHTTGKAADLSLSYQQARSALTTISTMFEGVGLNQKGDGRFIHVDMLGERIWTY